MGSATKTKGWLKAGSKKSVAKRAAEDKQADQQKRTSLQRVDLRARLGPTGARTVLAIIRTVLVAATFLAAYAIAMFAGVTVVPNVFLIMAAGTGVGPTSPLQMQLAHWLAPSIFLSGLIFTLVVYVVYALWRARARLSKKARRVLLDEDTDNQTTNTDH